MQETLNHLIATSSVAIALFGALFCLMQKYYQATYRAFAVFLVAVALNNFPSMLMPIIELQHVPRHHAAILTLELFGGLCLAPAFWIYVHLLTSASQKLPIRWYLHLILPGLSLANMLAIFALPEKLRGELFSEQVEFWSGWPLIYAFLIALLSLLIYPQLGLYIVLVIRRLARYRKRLKDLYASTERHELHWIVVIGLLAMAFWAIQVAELLDILGLNFDFWPLGIFDIAGFALFLVTSLWGLRQRPSLLPEKNIDQSKTVQVQKYENSALSPADATRIEQKLHAAMRDDRLHQDPNLSLWDLARHLGASPNYISQTLNEKIGENFFDFVNRYRIADAKIQLVQSNNTVIAIAYDVGFNSRSSFYTAFKKVTGETPTAYRKNMSEWAELDDNTPQSGHI